MKITEEKCEHLDIVSSLEAGEFEVGSGSRGEMDGK